MKPIKWLFIAHVLALLLASTGFSILTFLSKDVPLNWEYMRYAYESGWGYVYESDYSLPQVLTYVVAYSVGLVAFLTARTRGHRLLGISGAVLCLLGVVSFCIEASHWVIVHNLSWVASFPLLLVILWVWWVGQEIWLLKRVQRVA